MSKTQLLKFIVFGYSFLLVQFSNLFRPPPLKTTWIGRIVCGFQIIEVKSGFG